MFTSCRSPSHGALDAALYHLKNGLKLLKDVESIWARRCSIAEAQRRRNINANLPICRLPSEILSLIFLPHPLDQFDSVDNYEAFRTAVGGVCSRFRNVLLGTPSCWSNIWIDTTRISNMDTTPESRICTLIERSSNAPLRIWITCTDFGDTNPISSRRKRTMANFLKQHAPRCQTLGLTVENILTAVKMTAEGTWSGLQHLLLSSNFELEEENHGGFLNWPVLRNSLLSLSVFDTAANDSPSFVLQSLSPVFNPTTLTRLVLDVPLESLSNGSDFLKLCVHLEDLSWTYAGEPDDDDYLSLAGHVFTHLKELRFDGNYPCIALEHAAAPQLKELYGTYTDAGIDDVVSFFASPMSYPCLRIIDCKGAGRVPVERFRALIGRNSAVEWFSLSTGWENMVEILGCLSEPLYSDLASSERHDGVTGRGRLPWPNLEDLDLAPREPGEQINPMIASIVDILRSNKEVTVHFARPVKWPTKWKDSIDALLREYPSRVIFKRCTWV